MPGLWVEMNGQTISDSDSVYDGVTIEDLNGDDRFLRGSSTSGTIQADQFQGFNRSRSGAVSGAGANCIAVAGGFQQTNIGAGTGWWMDNETTQSIVTDGTNGTPRVGSETRPVNMSVVWILRIK